MEYQNQPYPLYLLTCHIFEEVFQVYLDAYVILRQTSSVCSPVFGSVY